MPLNPCGFACDIGRKPYTVKARVFADSDLEVSIRWYAVPWGTPWLPFESCIVSQAWDQEPWARTGIGEVLTPYLKFNTWARPPLPAEPHICGTPEEFVNGVTFDPERNVQYTTQGLPTCCVAGGGVVVGGDFETLYAGGVVIGGEFDTSPGGVLIGGEFDTSPGGVLIGGDDWDIIPPPATSCVDAGPISLGVTYHRTIYPGVDQWYKLTLAVGVHHITRPGADDPAYPLPAMQHGVCPGGLIPDSLSHGLGSSCWQFTATVAGDYWLRWFAPAAPIGFDFTVDTGPC